MHSSNSYVSTSCRNIISVQLLQVSVMTQVFMSRQHFYSGYVATLSCIICISVMTQKVYRDRGLLPLSLTSCYSFALMLQHEFLVSLIFAIATQFSYSNKTLLCSAYSFCHDPVSYVAAALLCIVFEIFVATYKSLSRPRFSLFSLFLCCDIKIHVAT